MFVGPKAAHHIPGAVDQLNTATHLASDGEHMPHIFQQTGWFQNKEDGQWRREVPDKDMKLTGKLKSGDIKRLDEVIKHDNLFRAAPEIRNVTVSAGGHDLDRNTAAAYYPGRRHISIKDPGKKKDLAHEIQHAVQENQHFPTQSRGAMMNGPGGYSEYKKNLGEQESRDVESRLGNTNPSRKPRLCHKAG